MQVCFRFISLPTYLSQSSKNVVSVIINDTGCFAAQYGKIQDSQKINMRLDASVSPILIFCPVFSRTGHQHTLYLIIPVRIDGHRAWVPHLKYDGVDTGHVDLCQHSHMFRSSEHKCPEYTIISLYRRFGRWIRIMY